MLLFLLACTGAADPAPTVAESPSPVQSPGAVAPDAVAEVAEEETEAKEDETESPQDAATADSIETPEAEPEATEPEAAEPEATEPEAAEPEAAEPEEFTSEETEPEEAEPEETEPEETTTAVTATTYTLSSTASTLYVQVFKDPDTVGAGISHDHVVVAKGWSGTVTWHPTDASQCQIDIRVPVSKLVVDAPSMRTAVGYDGELSESQRRTVKKNMLASDQLNVSMFPDITFSSTTCDATTGEVTITGVLAIRGQRKTISARLQVSLDQGFSAAGSFTARHTDFGFDPYTAMMGALKNRNQMRFSVTLNGR